MENVVLVDENNSPIGIENKLKVHKLGLLHRAFSILIYNSKKELLLQRRSEWKYHTPNLWTNACCSHPHVDETYEDAICRRLEEEMGLNCVLDKQFSFIYKAKLDSDMIEYEHDTVFIGQTDDNPRVNSNEVRDYRYIDYQSLKNEISIKPNSFTPWFKLIIDKIDLNFFKVNKYFLFQ